jgi:hypothetical protein
MSDQRTGPIQGRCFCGAVEIEVSGKPNLMGYCHCHSCQSWSGAPAIAFTLWPRDSVKVTKGKEDLGTFNKTKLTDRKFCRACGGHVMTELSGRGIVDVFATTIPGLNFVPQMHVHYADRILPVRDGLPKFKDLPSGSGEMLPE